VVKIAKQELEIDNTFLQCSNVFASFVFVELSDSSSGEDLIPLPLLMELLKSILQPNAYLSTEPSTHVGNIHFFLSYLCAMVLLRQTLNEL
jgi:hypothetical protein